LTSHPFTGGHTSVALECLARRLCDCWRQSIQREPPNVSILITRIISDLTAHYFHEILDRNPVETLFGYNVIDNRQEPDNLYGKSDFLSTLPLDGVRASLEPLDRTTRDRPPSRFRFLPAQRKKYLTRLVQDYCTHADADVILPLRRLSDRIHRFLIHQGWTASFFCDPPDRRSPFLTARKIGYP